MTLASGYTDWFRFTERFTASRSDAERRDFYCDTARRAYAASTVLSGPRAVAP